MASKVAKVIEIVGTSETSIADAVKGAVKTASETVRNMQWVEVTQIRAAVEDDKVDHFQVMMKIGFGVEK